MSLFPGRKEGGEEGVPSNVYNVPNWIERKISKHATIFNFKMPFFFNGYVCFEGSMHSKIFLMKSFLWLKDMPGDTVCVVLSPYVEFSPCHFIVH